MNTNRDAGVLKGGFGNEPPRQTNADGKRGVQGQRKLTVRRSLLGEECQRIPNYGYICSLPPGIEGEAALPRPHEITDG